MSNRRIDLLAGLTLAGAVALCAALPSEMVGAAGGERQLVDARPFQIPAPVGLVSDFAHVIPPGNAAHITQIASDVRTKSRGEMTVVTLPDIGLRAPADVALEIGRQWKVGKIGAPGDPTRNAGAVILLVPKETSSDGHGHCFIATGRGTEGFITDGDAGDICREATPYFQARDYGTGIELVTYRTAQRFADEFHFTIDTTVAATESPARRHSSGRQRSIDERDVALRIVVSPLCHLRVTQLIVATGRGAAGLPADLPSLWRRMGRWGRRWMERRRRGRRWN
jgi:uncharacterized membrane protein YgcG